MSAMRLYGSVIAIVSGGYSFYLSTAGTAMNTSAWFMLALGLVVIVHGVLLLTPLASWLRAGSGIAMIVYSVLMLLNQGWMWTMGTPMGMVGGAMTRSMGWNPGMIAITALMLISGIIMTAHKEMM